jgi:predicted small integral membrane protein
MSPAWVVLAGEETDMLRIAKILLVAAVVAWAVVGLWTNLAELGSVTGAVAAVTSMGTVPADDPLRGRATTSELIIFAGGAFILLFKLATAGLCAAGVWRMWSSRSAEAGAFAKAKNLALAGCSVAVLGLFVGWIVIAEEWFETFRSAHDAGELAFRFGGFIGLIALMVATRDE